MRYSVRPWLVLLVLALLWTGACDDDIPTAPTTPTQPVTVTFSGTLARNGAQTHDFQTQTSGTVTATLTSIDPADSGIIGFSLGTWNGTVCQAVLANDAAAQSAVLTGTVASISSLCVRMYDVGNVPEDGTVAYTVQVVHP
jgi:hypothetical protein